MKEIIKTEKAPKAIGPYSQAVVAGGFLYSSGQIPINPETGNIQAQDVQGQTRQVLENLGSVLKAYNLGFEHIVKTTVFIRNMDDFGAVNSIYGEYFKEPFPARSCVEAARLPKDALVEIEIIAEVRC